MLSALRKTLPYLHISQTSAGHKSSSSSNFALNNVNIAENKYANNQYEILEKFIAGIVLEGTEVKSCRRGGSVILSDGDISIRDQECWLDNVHIAEYNKCSIREQHKLKRSRKLLLIKREILKLEQRIIQKNYHILPLRRFFGEKNFVKVELGVGPAKSAGDKRDELIKKDGKREIRRVMKGGYDD